VVRDLDQQHPASLAHHDLTGGPDA